MIGLLVTVVRLKRPVFSGAITIAQLAGDDDSARAINVARRIAAPLERQGALFVGAAMPSTVIRRFVYCPDNLELWVEFTTGRRYVYSQVPREVADTFRSAFAKGVYFNTRIRDRYPYREITHEDRDEQATQY